MCVKRPWPKIIHLAALVPKLYLTSQAPAIAPDLYLPVQVKMFTTATATSTINITVTSTATTTTTTITTTPTATTTNEIITKNVFAGAKSALNGS